jgi:hypothetical protein
MTAEDMYLDQAPSFKQAKLLWMQQTFDFGVYVQ